jgi:hypothetical protein
LRKFRKCGKSLESKRKCDKCWESLQNAEKVWESVQNVEKVCKMLRNCAKCCESVQNVEKVWENMKNVEKVWESVQNVEKVWESVPIACEKIVVCFWSIFFWGGGPQWDQLGKYVQSSKMLCLSFFECKYQVLIWWKYLFQSFFSNTSFSNASK